MLFRRIKAHIEKENWFAVFIDFLIVVVGVFIGIQVSNWNEARVTERDANSARANLIADLHNDRDVYDVRKKFYLEVRNTALRVENTLDSKLPQSLDAQWQFIYDANNAGSMWPFKPSAQVYNQLLNSGKLSLLSTNSVRRQMRDYYQDAALEAGLTFKFDSDYRYRSRGLIDGALNEYNIEACGNIIGADPSNILETAQNYIPNCAAPELSNHIQETAQRIYESEGLINDIRLQISQLGSLLAFLDYLDDEAEALIKELEKS